MTTMRAEPRRSLDEERAVGGQAGVKGDGLDTAADALTGAARRSGSQAMDIVQHSLRALTDLSQPAVTIFHDQSRRAAEAMALFTGSCHKAAEDTASDVHALVAAYMRLGCGMQELQHTYANVAQRSMEAVIRGQQALLGCRSFDELAQVQQGMFRDAMRFMVEAGVDVLQTRTRAAQGAVEPLRDRAQHYRR